MSDDRRDNPFASPDTQDWQGTPVPPSAPPAAPPPTRNDAQQTPAVSPQAVGGYPPPAPVAAYPPPPPVGYGAGYGYAPSPAPANTAKNWMGIVSLVLSLATIFFGITCIGGVVFGHMGLAAAKRGEANNRGIALAGAIVGWVFLILGILFFGAIILFSLAASGSS